MDNLRHFKLSGSPMQICDGNKTIKFAELLFEAYSYEYETEPRYDYLKSILQKIAKNG